MGYPDFFIPSLVNVEPLTEYNAKHWRGAELSVSPAGCLPQAEAKRKRGEQTSSATAKVAERLLQT